MKSALCLALSLVILSTSAFADPLLSVGFKAAEGVSVQQKIISLYKSSMADKKTALAKAFKPLENINGFVAPKATDVVFIESNTGGADNYSETFLLPIRQGWKSSTYNVAYIEITLSGSESRSVSTLSFERLVDIQLVQK